MQLLGAAMVVHTCNELLEEESSHVLIKPASLFYPFKELPACGELQDDSQVLVREEDLQVCSMKHPMKNGWIGQQAPCQAGLGTTSLATVSYLAEHMEQLGRKERYAIQQIVACCCRDSGDGPGFRRCQ